MGLGQSSVERRISVIQNRANYRNPLCSFFAFDDRKDSKQGNTFKPFLLTFASDKNSKGYLTRLEDKWYELLSKGECNQNLQIAVTNMPT